MVNFENIFCESYIIDFMQVVKAGSLEKASETCSHHKTTVKRNVDKLEKYVGCKLFFNEPGKAGRLTPEGKALYNMLVKFIKAAESESLKFSTAAEIRFPKPAAYSPFGKGGAYFKKITDGTFSFDFKPENEPAPLWISMVYQFEDDFDAAIYKNFACALDFLEGDFNQVDVEFHGLDEDGNMNRYSKPVNIFRKDSGTVTVPLDNHQRSLHRLKEVCFVIQNEYMDDCQKSGSFRVSNMCFE